MKITKRKIKELTIISGKGGAGKTTLTAAFATLCQNKVLADCDVDAPDLHIILKPEVKEEKGFSASKLAEINKDLCISCGRCRQHCRFSAITEDIEIISERCEGCGVCSFVCPVKAIKLVERDSGRLFISHSRAGPFVHAKLFIGEEASGKLVELVRFNARKLAEKEKKKMILIDGPPGIGCPVIASIRGVSLGLVVTEPTLSGISDMKRILKIAEYFKVPSVVVINKYDLNLENTEEIENFCEKKGIELLGKLPYNSVTTKAMLQEMSVVEYINKTGEEREFGMGVENLWKKVSEILF